MTETKDFTDYVMEHTPHCTTELICIRCFCRWIGVYPITLPLKHLQCPDCGDIGTVITTGQILEEDYYGDT